MREAIVQTGAVETRYRRVGQGPQLLLLATAPEPDWMTRAIEPLAQRFRVFVPEVPAWATEAPWPAASSPAGDWLRGLIDGLGLDCPGVVAGSEMTGMLTRFVNTDADRLDRVAVIHHPSASPAPSGDPAVQVFPAPDNERVLGELVAFLSPGG
jgi:hypothetical protein